MMLMVPMLILAQKSRKKITFLSKICTRYGIASTHPMFVELYYFGLNSKVSDVEFTLTVRVLQLLCVSCDSLSMVGMFLYMATP